MDEAQLQAVKDAFEELVGEMGLHENPVPSRTKFWMGVLESIRKLIDLVPAEQQSLGFVIIMRSTYAGLLDDVEGDYRLLQALDEEYCGDVPNIGFEDYFKSFPPPCQAPAAV